MRFRINAHISSVKWIKTLVKLFLLSVLVGTYLALYKFDYFKFKQIKDDLWLI